MGLNEKYINYRRRKIIDRLRKTSPLKFEKFSANKVLPVFQHAAKYHPAYQFLLRMNNIDPKTICDIKDFTASVPLSTKENYFSAYDFPQLIGNNLRKTKLMMSSSGYSGTFAYGFNSKTAVKKAKYGVDITLDYWFDISNYSTFLINCAPMGVHVETSLPIAEVSVRSDMAISLLKKISPSYEQTIIVGDPNFMKKLIEEGCEENIDWAQLNVSIITAQDWLPENLRTYLYGLIGIDPDNPGKRGIYATMGMTELGLNIFHETSKTVALRRKILRDSELQNKLYGSDMKAPPCFFHYYPFRTYIEPVRLEQIDELAFTNLDKECILPVIRYRTGDRGNILSYKQLEGLLTPNYKELIPDLKLPIGIISGRVKNLKYYNNKHLCLEDVKESLFHNKEIAKKITGLASLKTANGKAEVIVHLNKGVKPDNQLKKRLSDTLNSFLGTDINVKPEGYYDLRDAIELNYERKLFLP